MNTYGPSLTNRTLLVPAIGVVVLLVTYLLPLDSNPTLESWAVHIGVTLVIVGTTLAALVGHIIWLVPVVMLLFFPLMVVSYLWELLRGRWKRPREKSPISDHDETS